jgi:hypothetical protein
MEEIYVPNAVKEKLPIFTQLIMKFSFGNRNNIWQKIFLENS